MLLARLALALGLFVPGLSPASFTLEMVGVECLGMRAVGLTGEGATLVCVRPLPETRAYLLAILQLDRFLLEAYWVLLWRQPDGPGLAYWRGELLAGRRSREYVINALIDSPEYAAVRR